MNTLEIATVTSAVRMTVARMREADPYTDADALLALVDAEVPSFADIMTALCRAADEASHASAMVDARIGALKERERRLNAQHEEYRRLIFAAMDAAGQLAWKSPEFTVSLSPGRPGVVITDPEAIPGAFMRVRREPDKTAIGAAIASGADIPGAEMRNGLPALTIRTK